LLKVVCGGEKGGDWGKGGIFTNTPQSLRAEARRKRKEYGLRLSFSTE
jgi:hypothetical protein